MIELPIRVFEFGTQAEQLLEEVLRRARGTWDGEYRNLELRDFALDRQEPSHAENEGRWQRSPEVEPADRKQDGVEQDEGMPVGQDRRAFGQVFEDREQHPEGRERDA